ncbi:fungal specific transcription factor [Penicillium angulare]|uniref:fungal specific transcription factor n=1 Tax=Penicillium angulare TaxID=116970 RepID=UPI0025413E83|nr:fungal specific transcription factor [Penicillium angulare]KAJ5256743.1 fungal specific transcription factor [Penicillium angulare]
MTVSNLSPKLTRDASLGGPSFRNVSACKRCRLRKHRCDQSLPRCKPCEKSQSRCVGYDPISKREVPRSYVYYLENRLKYLDSLLFRHKIPLNPGIELEDPDIPCKEQRDLSCSNEEYDRSKNTTSPKVRQDECDSQYSEQDDIFLGSVESLTISTNDPCFRGTTNFRVLSATGIEKVLSGATVRHVMTKESRGARNEDTGSVRTSLYDLLFDGPKAESLELPRQREEAEELTRLYFEHINPYTPVLRRDDFQKILDDLYLVPKGVVCSLKLYTAFMVFAIGAEKKNLSIIKDEDANNHVSPKEDSPHVLNAPELYRSSAMVHLESYLSISRPLDYPRKLEELQALILLSLCTLLRPATPSLERLVHVAMRSATDLRLYSDYNFASRSGGHDSDPEEPRYNSFGGNDIVDLRRRLWWSIYSLERLSAPYLGRPFFIPDEVVTTQYPSTADDSPLNGNEPLNLNLKISQNLPSYRYATHHVMKLRTLQSEIHRMIQCQHSCSTGTDHSFQSSLETSRSLARCGKFISWRRDMTTKLDRWRLNIPRSSQTCLNGCEYMMELEYWQNIITLYRQNVLIPEDIVEDHSIDPHPCQCLNESRESELTESYFKLVKACQRVIQLYREMRFLGLNNISYLSTNWIFIAGEQKSHYNYILRSLIRRYQVVFFFAHSGVPFRWPKEWYVFC